MLKKWAVRFIAVLGLLLLFFPLVSSYMQGRYQSDAVSTYQKELEQKDKEDLKGELERAEKYNSMLYQSNGAIIDNMDHGILSDDSYNSLLNQKNGVMGAIEIPKIGVDLPIYHGTSDEVLSNAVGHQQGTSLPIGGENTHCVLTGHRGLPGAKLFTRLDEMQKGDLFFLKVMGKKLAYKVDDIKVIEPSEVSVLDIKEGRDAVSLITCTPYGINTHRLVVTGTRVDYSETEYQGISETVPSAREIVFAVLPFLIILLAVIMKIVDWRKNRYE